MQFVVTHALRLVRGDLARLTEIHRAQFVEAIAPGKPDVAESLVETGGDDDEGDAHGLVYLRFHDEARTASEFEGWLLDLARSPEKTTSPDGGAFFHADTTKPSGVEMSQSSLSARGKNAEALRDAIAGFLRGLRVVVRGTALKTNPPFARAAAPSVPKPAMKSGTTALRVLGGHRYTEGEMRAAPEAVRFQFLHAVRPKFAMPTSEKMEGFSALGGLYGMIDPGPDAGKPNLAGGHRRGVVHVRLADGDREYDGWFWCGGIEDPNSYWPSRHTAVVEGRLMVAGGVTHTGVEVAKGRVRVDSKRAQPFAKALAKGLQQLGLTFDVDVPLPPAAGQKGYFGSEFHARQIRETRAYEADEAARTKDGAGR